MRGELRASGRFSLGYPRKDNGEELKARIAATEWPLAELRHAFHMDKYEDEQFFEAQQKKAA